MEIEVEYLDCLSSAIEDRSDAKRFELREADFFRTDWDSLLAEFPQPFLIAGNPPWVTSADIGRGEGDNLPQKSNFRKYAGVEAITGKTNFDISEWMLIQNLKWIGDHRADCVQIESQSRSNALIFQHNLVDSRFAPVGLCSGGCLAMLCKTAVARKLLRHAWRAGISITDSHMMQIDAMKHLSASVDACFPSLKINEGRRSSTCAFFDSFDTKEASNVLGHHDGIMLSCVDRFYEHKEFLGPENRHYTWRSGVKHDLAKVMELRKVDGGLRNGHDGEFVEIEGLCVFPLMKSSDLGNGRVKETPLNVLAPQRSIGQSTDYIRSLAPLTWQYLEKYAEALDGRRSAIYRNKPRFSVFGVGDYTFTDWKVVISGFYKRLDSQVVGSIEGKLVVFDDTIYFLSTTTQAEATFLADLLNSDPCQRFLESMVF